jgi:hypothetical protein
MPNYLIDYADSQDARGIMAGLETLEDQLRIANLIALGEKELAREALGLPKPLTMTKGREHA